MPDALEIARWLIVILLSLVLLTASLSDIRHRRIPNWTILAVAALFVPWVFIGVNVSILSSVGAAVVAFVISAGLYAFRVLGAGDSKLITAAALFVGWSQLFEYLFLVAIAGGVIALASLALRPGLLLVMFQMRGRQLLHGRGVPYGVAIALGAVCIVLSPLTRMA